MPVHKGQHMTENALILDLGPVCNYIHLPEITGEFADAAPRLVSSGSPHNPLYPKHAMYESEIEAIFTSTGELNRQ